MNVQVSTWNLVFGMCVISIFLSHTRADMKINLENARISNEPAATQDVADASPRFPTVDDSEPVLLRLQFRKLDESSARPRFSPFTDANGKTNEPNVAIKVTPVDREDAPQNKGEEMLHVDESLHVKVEEASIDQKGDTYSILARVIVPVDEAIASADIGEYIDQTVSSDLKAGRITTAQADAARQAKPGLIEALKPAYVRNRTGQFQLTILYTPAPNVVPEEESITLEIVAKTDAKYVKMPGGR